ncbi:hypothetical protein FBF48_10390 [Streptococcus salivarius]|uniref:DUF2829 domain-containing protein n=1 Tax=Streptococcus salivarius TaxID=1304 RepID=A0AAX2UZ93_STRSL|nr:hypothetical protein [Streptococcus salivarius]TNF65654.1 hypothetical protein FBF48_10390 [Streptococcus salivarius]
MAAKKERFNITFPIGRYVSGSLYAPRTTDYQGNPLIYKTGQKTGQPRSDWSFGVAFAKTAAGHWANEPWGKIIWEVGHKMLANAGQLPHMSWKVEDGDDATPNRNGKRNCDREGWPGHWVVFFNNAGEDMRPNIWDSSCKVQLREEGLIKPGYYIQVAGNVSANDNPQNPGVYIGHDFIAWMGVCPDDQIIQFGPDIASTGLGNAATAGAVPAGMMAVPATPAQQAMGHAAPPPPGAPAAPAAPAYTPPPAVPAAPGAPAAAYVPPPAAAPAPPVAVTPNPAMTAVQPPLAPAGAAVAPPTHSAPATPPAPPSAPPAAMSPSSPQMTAKAAQEGQTYEGLKGAGWNDDQMRQYGYIV